MASPGGISDEMLLVFAYTVTLFLMLPSYVVVVPFPLPYLLLVPVPVSVRGAFVSTILDAGACPRARYLFYWRD